MISQFKGTEESDLLTSVQVALDSHTISDSLDLLRLLINNPMKKKSKIPMNKRMSVLKGLQQIHFCFISSSNNTKSKWKCREL